MFDYVEIVPIYFFTKFNILYHGEERPAETKLMPAKLRAVVACAESTPCSVSLRQVRLRTVLAYLVIWKFFQKFQHVGPSFSVYDPAKEYDSSNN